MELGSGRVGRGLSQQFKITGRLPTGLRTPKGFKQKKGRIFQEMGRARIDTPSEVRLLRQARKRKKRRKR